ncbi:MAG: hypothetical protein RXQ68_00740 [Candidatus Nanopusillus sp.]
MKLFGGLDRILKTIEDNVKGSFEKIKDEANGSIKYLDERLREIGNKISEYKPIIGGAAIAALPLYAKVPILAGLQIENLYKGPGGKILKYVLIGGSAITLVGLGVMLGLNAIHSLPSNNEHIQYLGNGYEGFVPNGQTINYDGNTDPEGELILNNGTTMQNVIWNGQYASTIIQNHNQIVQLNNQFVGQTDPINNQPYVPLQDVYIIKGQVPVEQVTINGQTYYVIEANNINPADIAGFYTYQGWVSNFVAAMNTPGTYAAGLPGNSPVFQWTNTTGTVVYQTQLYEGYGVGGGSREVLIELNGTIIPYGVTYSPLGSALFNFTTPQQTYNPSS